MHFLCVCVCLIFIHGQKGLIFFRLFLINFCLVFDILTCSLSLMREKGRLIGMHLSYRRSLQKRCLFYVFINLLLLLFLVSMALIIATNVGS